ncbi:MAG: serine hydrolase [Limosilactobacillus sp.]|jgi:D-alanyl-D-alanine carboxypeptidase (penicillin-binding protein 5/6)|uniref:D-alanyl-D-alanine carboxypeptidase family protein n=1 Tax=Limosilactobacillus sp. TaxID=2773925 RepID=UPI0025BE3702|nr:serine hydrolase [Limosilactobacillus sp.]MCI1974569.1 serine hydrolase [Limosilactobacillus sp.]MCI2031207.1 serine hydrolase [Limosilactobacillus sp.]
MKKFKKIIIMFLIAILTVNVVSIGEINSVKADATKLNLNARAAYAIDAETGQVLYQKNANKTYPVASLTKVLTLAVIEQDVKNHHLRWQQKVKITPAVAKVANDWHFSNVPLNAGESYTIRQLAESMMIVSADGSAEALALADAGSTEAFNKKMQAVAKKAGVTDAKIYNMIGLANGDLGKNRVKAAKKTAENQFSAKDMALISKYLIETYPDSLKITKTKFANFRVSANQEYRMININSLLPENGFAPKNGTIDGLKTGNTDTAGKCIISTGTFAGRRIIVVALHTKGDWNAQSKDAQQFYEKLTDVYQPTQVNSIKQLSRGVQDAHVVHAKDKHSTGLKLEKTTTIWLPKGTTTNSVKANLNILRADRSITHQLKAPVKRGQHVGYITLKPTGMSPFTIPVKATDNVQKNGWF